MEIKTEDYRIWYDEPTGEVLCEGSFRLGSVEEYEPIAQLLRSAAAAASENLTLNLRNLQFLNSAGINVLSLFVISVRQQGSLALTVLGSKAIPWQTKSLPNLRRLMPALTLSVE